MKAEKRKLNFTYFCLQALFWGAAVVNYAYMTQIMEYKGYSEVEIGILNGVKLLIGVVFQIWIGDFADRHLHSFPLKTIIALLSLISAVLTFALMFVGHNFIVMLFLSVGFGIAFTTISPLIDSLSMLYINHGVYVNYAKGRTGGSIAWAVFCVLAGIYCDKVNIGSLPFWGVLFLLILMVIAVFMPWNEIKEENFIKVEENKSQMEPHSVSYLLINYPRYTLFLLGSAIMFMGYNFGSTFLIDIYITLGGNNTHFGIGEFVMAMSEVPAALIVLKQKDKIPVKWFMLCCAFFMTIKNLVPTYSTDINQIIAAQACEMLGFGLYYAGSIYYISELLPEVDIVKATTLISVTTVGAGEGIASLLCGVIRNYAGLYGLMKIATLTNAFGIIVMTVMCSMKKKKQRSAG